MSWQPLATAWPASAAAIAAGTDAVLAALPGELSAAGARLAAIEGQTNFSASPLAGPAATIAGSRTALADLIDGEGWLLGVDPWSAGSGDYLDRHLSPPNAIAALAAKLRDADDHRRPTSTLDMVAVLVYATTLAGLAAELAALNTIVPVLGYAQRRAAQLADIDTTKWIDPIATSPLHWQKKPLRWQLSARAADAALGQAVAMVESVAAETTTPTAELAALIDKKTAAITAAQQAVDDAAARFGGGAGSGLFASGSSLPALAATLSGTSPADHSYTLTAGLCLIGPSGSLVFFKEAFGL